MKDFSRRLKKLEASSGKGEQKVYVLISKVPCKECGGAWQNDDHDHKYGCPCLSSNALRLIVDKDFDVTGRS